MENQIRELLSGAGAADLQIERIKRDFFVTVNLAP
jgi:hypothetical protein